MPVCLAGGSYGCRVGDKFHSPLCWVAPAEMVVGLYVAGRNDA